MDRVPPAVMPDAVVGAPRPFPWTLSQGLHTSQFKPMLKDFLDVMHRNHLEWRTDEQLIRLEAVFRAAYRFVAPLTGNTLNQDAIRLPLSLVFRD